VFGLGINGEVSLIGIAAILSGIGSLLTAITGAYLSVRKGREEERAALVSSGEQHSLGRSSGSPGSDSLGSEQPGADKHDDDQRGDRDTG
jgi:hypothetical protein